MLVGVHTIRRSCGDVMNYTNALSWLSTLTLTGRERDSETYRDERERGRAEDGGVPHGG